MARAFVATFALAMVAVAVAHDRLPPGVNPNAYQQGQQAHHHQQAQFQQQQQAPQYQQQQPVPLQQVPQQQVPQQQVPQQQQFQQQVPQQNVPQQHVPQQQPVQQQAAHGHGHHGQQQQVLHRDMAHEREHMKEHMEVPIDTSKMSEQELQFHYFKMHDADGNNKLDGCELVKSLIHWHEGESHDGHDHEPPPHYEDTQLEFMIDPLLKSDDINNDGMIDYAEFIAAQLKNKAGLRDGVQMSV